MEFPRDLIAEFLQRNITGDLYEVPGIDQQIAMAIYHNAQFDSTFNIIGKYLSGVDNGPITPYRKFYNWLIQINIPQNNAQLIARSIAEKISTMMPGLYDPAQEAQ